MPEIDCKNLLVKNMKNYWQPKKKRKKKKKNNTLRFSQAAKVEAHKNVSSKWKFIVSTTRHAPPVTP